MTESVHHKSFKSNKIALYNKVSDLVFSELKMTNLPAEIFEKIFENLQKRGSQQDIKNVGHAVSGTHLEKTFKHLTLRPGSKKCQPGNFICPICLFREPPNYESIFEEICLEIFEDHWQMLGASKTVEGSFTENLTTDPPLKRRRLFSTDARDQKIFTNPDHINNVKFGNLDEWKACDCNACKKSTFMIPLAKKFVNTVHNAKFNEKILDTIASELNAERMNIFRNIPLFSDVNSFIKHMNESHSDNFSCSLNCNNFGQKPCSQVIPCTLCTMNYDSIYRAKSNGANIDDIIRPSHVLKSLKSAPKLCIPILKGIREPRPYECDTDSRNSSFLLDIAWPILGLAITLQLENHLLNPTRHFEIVDDSHLRCLALRDLLHCFCQVTECIEFDFELKTWIKGKFGTIHGLLEILDSFFPNY